MYMAPHHFQMQSQYFEDAIRFAASTLWFAPYGVSGVEFDAEALQNDTVKLLHARGWFPDGLSFNMPETDALPHSRAIADLFPPAQNAVTVLLGIPARKPRGLNCTIDDGELPGRPETRYAAELRVTADENTGCDERPIRVARKRLRLMLDTEPADDMVTLPLARILRDGGDRLVYDPEFVPPVLQIHASERLMLVARRLIEILEEKTAAIALRASNRSEFSAREIATFWLLHAVNSATATLRHLVSAKRGHPEELFIELSRLAGALCTFKLDSHPRALPVYDHGNLTSCFNALDRHIREHLEITVPTSCISVPLVPAGGYFHDGEVSDQRCLGRSRWILAVRASLGEADLMAKVPRLVKICSPPFVRELVKRALPGLALTHLPVPPPAISPDVEKQYFGISRIGPCWEHIAQTSRVGVYVPGEIPNPDVEILVALEK
jgi:type VI secretion system protein ImpJ